MSTKSLSVIAPPGSHVKGFTLGVKGRLFAGLAANVTREIVAVAQPKHIKARQQITLCGGRPDHLFLLRAGRARSFLSTEEGAETLLLWLAPGDVIGLVSLMSSPPHYMANASTVTDCEFLVWDHHNLRRLAKTFPTLLENGLRMGVHYLKVFIERHASSINQNAESRLAQTLLQLATRVGDVQPSGVIIEITNEQLGSLSDISSFTASRLLSRWERNGTVVKERGRVTLVAPEALMIP